MSDCQVVLVGQTPPPVHGQALAIARLVNAHFSRLSLHHVPLDMSDSVEEMGRVRLGKILRLFRMIWRVLRLRFRTGARVLYYPPAGPSIVPVLRDLVFLTFVRPFFPVLVLDFHAAGLAGIQPRLPVLLQLWFRRAYSNATLAIHKFPPQEEDGLLPARHRLVVPYGVEDEFPRFREMEPSASLNLLYVGLMTPSKGVFTLLEAVGQLRGEGEDVRATFVGEFTPGLPESEWMRRVDDLDLGDRVRHTGRLDGDPKWLEFRQATVFCFPSEYENEALPLAIIEAMQFALPVVASRWRGIPSLVEEGETGLLVPPGDADALAKHVASLASDAALRDRMGSAARRAFVRRYTIEAHLESMENAMLSACEAAVRPSQ